MNLTVIVLSTVYLGGPNLKMLNDQKNDLIQSFEHPDTITKMGNIFVDKKMTKNLTIAKYGDKLYQAMVLRTVIVDDNKIDLYNKEFDRNNKEIAMKMIKEYINGYLLAGKNRGDLKVVRKRSIRLPLVDDTKDEEESVGEETSDIEDPSSSQGSLFSWLYSIPIIGKFIPGNNNQQSEHGLRIIGGISSLRFTPVKFNLRSGAAPPGGGILELFQ